MRTPTRPVPPPARSSSRRGFTMVELLVVIGIIVILMSILIPAVGRVQTQARVADTRNQMSKIQSALENYYKDFHAYPGPIPNSEFGTSPTPPPPPVAPNGQLTMTENAGLGLWGGWDIDSAGVPKGIYNESSVGKGPLSFHPNPTKQKRSPAYLEPTPGQMTPPVNAANQWGTNGKSNPAASDSEIPEFMDKFQEPRPILFMRANVGASGVVAGYPGTTAANQQYDANWVAPYAWKSDDFAKLVTEFPKRDIGSNTVPAGLPSYLGHQSIWGVPRGQNTFILISAGADGIYGTKDDLIFP